MNTENGVITGRAYGGLAIMWRKTLAKFSNIVTYDCNRLLGIEIDTGNLNILVLNVYLPYCAPSNSEECQQSLGMIDSIMRECGSAKHILVIENFNADPQQVNGSVAHQFGKELSELCKQEGYKISDTILIDNSEAAFTHVSVAHGTTSWLDHVLTTSLTHALISDICIQYNFVTSDHVPLVVSLNLPALPRMEEEEQQPASNRRITWDKLRRMSTWITLRNYSPQ